MPAPEELSIGTHIRRYRQHRGMSLNRLAEKSGVSKGYLWNLENEETSSRPSAQTVFAIAEALEVTMADLLGRTPSTNAERAIPDSLREFAAERGLPQTDIQMLASIKFRGEQPATTQRWAFIYEAIRGSRHLDNERNNRPD